MAGSLRLLTQRPRGRRHRRHRVRQHAPRLVRDAAALGGLRVGRRRARGGARRHRARRVRSCWKTPPARASCAAGRSRNWARSCARSAIRSWACASTRRTRGPPATRSTRQSGVDRFVDLIAEQITLERLKLFHFNDTEIPLGGHRDRHWHIGEGHIGFAGFRALASRSELRDKPAILETPGEEADDVRNLLTIRAIFEGART